ncbi:TSUP family transporter [Serinibacter salmoneus]|uniref:Probable membrane transporter protein n=1 Tax=Serinibacter salmoneus TaxID=556530 RepID=A0A2A9D277_9MICO|nr:TSUP family transporter [Serinibacter salmoneus]PFG20763.1 hypothetical protein ATL40_2375 [Serinibacter salmoneus]
MPEVELTTLLLLILAGFAAGWIDAVVGGGGLIQLPALVLTPGVSTVEALATNKLASIMGTSVSSVTFYRRVHPDLTTAAPAALAALAGAFGGASLAPLIPAEVLQPVIVVALVLVLVLVVARPQLGATTQLRWEGNRHRWVAAGIGLVIGAYDGLLGPGTGTFLVLALVGVLGYAFLPASAIAKIINFATNLGALLFFIPHGSVLWGLGLIVGTANLLGGYLGARMAVARGSGFVRIILVVVVSALIVRMVWGLVS